MTLRIVETACQGFAQGAIQFPVLSRNHNGHRFGPWLSGKAGIQIPRHVFRVFRRRRFNFRLLLRLLHCGLNGNGSRYKPLADPKVLATVYEQGDDRKNNDEFSNLFWVSLVHGSVPERLI